MEKQILKEESSKEVFEQWKKDSKQIKNLEELNKFINHLLEDYGHDYGTIIHAMFYCMRATMSMVDNSPQGGITGFQASCLGWMMVRELFMVSDGPLQLVNYENMLYPHYQDKFEKTLDKATFEWLQKKAKEKINGADQEYKDYTEAKQLYDKELEAFIMKYPDYKDNPDKYKEIGMGTMEEYEEQNKKKKEGFEFAPTEPCPPVKIQNINLYNYWVDIINGKVPFGYKVKEED